MIKHKKEYLKYVEDARWAAIKRRGDRILKRRMRTDIASQWSRHISAEQREALVAAYINALAGDEARSQKLREVEHLRENADWLAGPGKASELSQYASLREVFEARKSLVQLAEGAHRAWQDFLHEQAALAEEARSTDAIDTTQQRVIEAANMTLEFEHARDEAETSSIPPMDAHGIRKIPRSWAYELLRNGPESAAKKEFDGFWKHEARMGDISGGNIGAGTARWSQAKVFGSGSAKAALWVRCDLNGVIRDRLVRKDYFFPEEWFDHRLWAWINFDRDNDDAMPWELHCQKLMTESTNTTNIVSLRRTDQASLLGCVDKHMKRWKVYTNYCPQGDLFYMIQDYAMFKAYVPEVVIFYVAEALAEACLAMKQIGQVDNGCQMVHRDLKPSNVFLDIPNPDFYPDHWTPRIGDFGSAICTSHDDPRNPRSWAVQQCCTEGFIPPELMAYTDYESGAMIAPTEQVLEHTNVWQFGMILRCLVLLDDPRIQALWLGDPATDTTYSMDGNERTGHYSEELIELIEDCMQYDCGRRPTFETILDRVRNIVARPGGINQHRNAWQNRPQTEEFIDRYGDFSEKYAIGLTYPPPADDDVEEEEEEEDGEYRNTDGAGVEEEEDEEVGGDYGDEEEFEDGYGAGYDYDEVDGEDEEDLGEEDTEDDDEDDEDAY